MYLSETVAITAQEGGLCKPDPQRRSRLFRQRHLLTFFFAPFTDWTLDKYCQIFQILKNDPTLVFGISQFV
jgi:hypothetical protein